jgi:hypothetical protein
MNKRDVRRQCRALVKALDIPVPFDARLLAERIAADRGRPLDLVPAAMPNDAPSGIWFATPERDIILYEQNTSPLHQEQIQLHEFGHVLRKHDAIGTTNPQTSRLLFPDPQTFRLLFPDLDPDVVNRSLHRSHYTENEEQEAELVASLILARARRLRPVSEWAAPADAAAIRQRIAWALEPPTDGS